MKLTLLIVSCLLFAAVQSAAVDLDSAHDAEVRIYSYASRLTLNHRKRSAEI